MTEEPASNTLPGSAPLAARKVWLTFDDGPHPQHTRKVLDVLKARGVVATFFVLGCNVEREGKDLLERARSEGHDIGNHGFSHRPLTTLSEPEVRAEIERTESLIVDLFGPIKLFRPPYGHSNAMIDRVLRELGYLKVVWQVNAYDWDPAYQPDRWVQHAVDHVRPRPRSIVLAHDWFATTADHVADLIDGIESLGPVTFERLWPVSLSPVRAGKGT